MGRPPIGKLAMSAAERMRLMRERQRQARASRSGAAASDGEASASQARARIADLGSIGLQDLQASVFRVGDGRGFLVATHDTAYIVTAAHCLPRLPPAHLGRFAEEATYGSFVGELGKEPSVAAACVFVNPMADIAVLGPPDDQAFYDEAGQYVALLENVPPFSVAPPPPPARFRLPFYDNAPFNFTGRDDVAFPVHVLSLEGVWLEATAYYRSELIRIEPAKVCVPGMSGLPVISPTGAALGVISTNNVASALTDGLPGRLLRTLI